MIDYILTTDYYVAQMIPKEWHDRDGIEGVLGTKPPRSYDF